MANRLWLEQLERRLAEGKLPAGYIRRFVDELADHFEDLTEDAMRKEADVAIRLGQPDQVAEAAVAAYRRRTFFGRHPSAAFWIFGISPVIAMLSTFVAACLGVAAVSIACQKYGVRLADKSHLGGFDPAVLSWALALFTTVLPAVLLTWLYCGLARRCRIDRKWMLASCGVLAVIAMLPLQSIALSELPGRSLWTIGLGFPPGLLQSVQLIVPLAVGLWLARPSRQRVPQEERYPLAA